MVQLRDEEIDNKVKERRRPPDVPSPMLEGPREKVKEQGLTKRAKEVRRGVAKYWVAERLRPSEMAQRVEKREQQVPPYLLRDYPERQIERKLKEPRVQHSPFVSEHEGLADFCYRYRSAKVP